MGTWSTIWHSLEEGFFMLWQTLWALVLGFALSGIVQAYVSRRTMVRTMGNHRPAAIARASLFGMASSSCSYAATTLARSLFARGADFTTSIVFMVASTNLVIELGLVMWRLLGWQFAAAEFVGGVIMIALLTAMLPKAVAPVAERPEPAAAADAPPRRPSAAARFALADLRMLRRELVIGFLVAGFLAVAVPTGVWTTVFVTGHGVWTAIENAIIGPAVAIVSFVCSIGNIPLAAALWQRGVSFGGVIAFIFADLLTLPLIVIYRKLYGGRITLRLVAVMWVAMSAAGLLTQAVFHAIGGIPAVRPALIAPEHFAWDATTGLNIVALAGLAALFALRRRDPGGDTQARCEHHDRQEAA